MSVRSALQAHPGDTLGLGLRLKVLGVRILGFRGFGVQGFGVQGLGVD